MGKRPPREGREAYPVSCVPVPLVCLEGSSQCDTPSCWQRLWEGDGVRRGALIPIGQCPPSCLKEACKEEGSGMLAVGWGAAWLSFPRIYQHPAPAFGWVPLGGDVHRARNPHVADHRPGATGSRGAPTTSPAPAMSPPSPSTSHFTGEDTEPRT